MYLMSVPRALPGMNAFAPRRTTETQISDAITLGWRIATLYSLTADELPSSPPDNLLPMRRSLPAAQRLALELHAAAGDADRLGVGLEAGRLGELIELAAEACGSISAEAAFRDRIRAWHIHLETMLWADHEATGKAYELGSFLSDTSNRVVCGLRSVGAADEDVTRDHVTRHLQDVFARDRIERVKRLLDDLQARIDPAAVRIVGEHLERWHREVQDRPPKCVTRPGLEPLDSQVTVWFQLVTGDKEPEAFINHEERAKVRGTMFTRTLRSYLANPRSMAALAAATVALLLVITQASGVSLLEEVKGTTLQVILTVAGSLAGALGLSLASIGRTVRQSLDARAELLWNTALVDVISRRTLRVDDLLEPPQSRRARVPQRARAETRLASQRVV